MILTRSPRSPTLRFVPLRAITGDENTLLLAAHPGCETVANAGFIAESCARGRPPFVAILHAGDETALRAAMDRLRLPPDRLLPMALPVQPIASDNALFAAIVRTLATLSWRVDCNLVCAPPEHLALGAVAAALGHATGLRRLLTVPDDTPSALHLDTTSHRAAREAALAIYGHTPQPRSSEAYLPVGSASC